MQRLMEHVEPRKAYDEYLEFKMNRFPKKKGRLLEFAGVDGKDVYNTSVPFMFDNRLIIAGRVEDRSSEDSSTMFFDDQDGKWRKIDRKSVV